MSCCRKIKQRKSGKNDTSKITGKKEDWWYQYYSRGLNIDKKKYINSDFMLAKSKHTPDFAGYKYEPKRCHYQIGQTAKKGSIIMMATTVGNTKKKKYITGYFKVKKVGRNCKSSKKGLDTHSPLYMDRDNSLLLLDTPIKLDKRLVIKLFPDKRAYWQEQDKSFVEKISSTLRNCHLTPSQKHIIIPKLKKLRSDGSKNYLGKNYQKLLKKDSDG